MSKLLLFILLCTSISSTDQVDQSEIVRKNPGSVPWKGEKIIPHYIDFQDTLMCDTLFEIASSDGLPVSYFRKVRTGVCVEGKCRLIYIWLYWDITGRYLGFELPRGEFLSKNEHFPFIEADYDKLHKLLGDPNSPLARYTINELAPKKQTTGVDAITSATISEVLESVVKGAVFTTYTLWHLVYGESNTAAENLTINKLNTDLIYGILQSPFDADNVWILNHIPVTMKLNPDIMRKILELVSGEDVYLAERALNGIPAGMLAEETTQQGLRSIFKNTGFIQKRLIIQRLAASPELSEQTINNLAVSLKELTGILVVQVLEMFKTHKINSEFVAGQVLKLLENENRFIAGKAFQFLSGLPDKDKAIASGLKKYEKRR